MDVFEESAAPPSTTGEPEIYTWTFPGAPIRIHLHLTVVERLAREVRRAFESVASHSMEVGGILYGKADSAARPVIEIKDFEPFPCESGASDTFILSEADRLKLDNVLAAGRSDGPEALSVVGYYRSHIGEGLSLRREDIAIAQSTFCDPAHVFLLVKPFSDGSTSAGFFFWEQGTVNSEFTFLEFPFEAQQLAGERVQPMPMWDTEAGSEEMPAEEAGCNLPATIPAAFETALPVAAARQRHSTALWRAMFVVLMIALEALGYKVYLARSRPRLSAMAPIESDVSALALQVERRGPDLRVSWNRNSRPVTRATSAVLYIRDGETQSQEWHLDRDQLRNANVLYTPANSSVRFRLEVTTPTDGKTSETFLALTAPKPDTEAALLSQPSRLGVGADLPQYQQPAISAVSQPGAKPRPVAASGARNRHRRAHASHRPRRPHRQDP